MLHLFLGAIPPPIGGVSIYCKRRLEQLKLQGVPVRFYNTNNRLNIISLIFFCCVLRLTKKRFLIEVNISSWLAILIICAFGLARKCIFVDHNSSRRFVKKKISAWVMNIFSERAMSVKLVNPGLKKNYASPHKVNFEMVSPFIAPSELEVLDAIKNFPPQHRSLLEKGEIVFTSAWRTVSSHDEYDLYGLLKVLDIYECLVDKCPSTNFVLIVGEITNDEYGLKVKKKIDSLMPNENFHFVQGNVSQLALLPNTKVFLRLTKTDGDSLGVREAISLNIPVIASNVVWRPDEVTLVDLSNDEKIKSLISSYLI
jgi:glycosyltransferase involved in cell wall biosynthesis